MAPRLGLAYAVIQPGLEDLLADELQDLGVACTKTRGGLSFSSSPGALHRVHLLARLPTRVWVRLGAFRAQSLDVLARGVRGLPWSTVMRPRQPVQVKVVTRRSRLRFRDRVARKAEHAVADALRSARGAPHRGPHRAPIAPQQVLVRIEDDEVEVSIDATGEPLFRRGWRQDIGGAPLRENLAAAVLRAVGWQPTEPLVDPMCGSGTFCIEAATVAAGRVPGGQRRFAFEQWPTHDSTAFRAAKSRLRPSLQGRAPILGSDRDAAVLRAAAANARRAKVGAQIEFSAMDVRAVTPPASAGLVVCNPPWGDRLTGAEPAWAALGRTLRDRFGGWRIALLSPGPALTSRLGFPVEPVANFPAGGIRISVCTGQVPR